MRRCGSISSPLAAAATLLFLLFVADCFHCAAAARLLASSSSSSSSSSSVPVPALIHHAENGVNGLGLQEGGVGNNGDDELSISEMMGAEEEEEAVACEEGDEKCLQRRLLRDAHLDYIYTQHKGKP